MKIPDLNVLLYAVDDTSARHEQARAWLEEQLSGSETTGFAWAVLVGFVRLATNPRVFAAPLDSGRAREIARALAGTALLGGGRPDRPPPRDHGRAAGAPRHGR